MVKYLKKKTSIKGKLHSQAGLDTVSNLHKCRKVHAKSQRLQQREREKEGEVGMDGEGKDVGEGEEEGEDEGEEREREGRGWEGKERGKQTYPHFGAPWTSLSRRGPDKFLASAVGMMGTAATGVAWMFVPMVMVPPT